MALKVALLQDRNIVCAQARPCIFQSGNFTGWGDEGVNAVLLYSAVFCDCGTAVPGHFTPVKGINTVQLYSVVFCIV